MDYTISGRDGCFDEDQLYAVFDDMDVSGLIIRLSECLSPIVFEKLTK